MSFTQGLLLFLINHTLDKEPDHGKRNRCNLYRRAPKGHSQTPGPKLHNYDNSARLSTALSLSKFNTLNEVRRSFASIKKGWSLWPMYLEKYPEGNFVYPAYIAMFDRVLFA